MDPKRVGESISRLLGLYLLQQAELGKQLAISPQTMTSIVRGQSEARASTYLKIFGWFGIDRIVEDFATALPEVLGNYPKIEKKAAAIRKKRR